MKFGEKKQSAKDFLTDLLTDVHKWKMTVPKARKIILDLIADEVKDATEGVQLTLKFQNKKIGSRRD